MPAPVMPSAEAPLIRWLSTSAIPADPVLTAALTRSDGRPKVSPELPNPESTDPLDWPWLQIRSLDDGTTSPEMCHQRARALIQFDIWGRNREDAGTAGLSARAEALVVAKRLQAALLAATATKWVDGIAELPDAWVTAVRNLGGPTWLPDGPPEHDRPRWTWRTQLQLAPIPKP